MDFRNYRKKTLTYARVLTERDYAARSGVILTNEGVQPFLPADYLARDSRGEWPISWQSIRTRYQRVSPCDADGFVGFQSVGVRQAAKMQEAFSLPRGLSGKAGDYLVREGEQEWVVDGALFEASYELVE